MSNRNPDPRQRIQRNRALAVQGLMILAGLSIGTYFLYQAVTGLPERRDFNIFATFGCYGVAAFYIWLRIRRWRQERRLRQLLAQRRGKKKPG